MIFDWLNRYSGALEVFVGILTFSLGYLIYKRFLFQHTRQKQLEVVSELINEIQSTFNLCNFKGSSSWVTLFDIAELETIDSYDSLYFFNQDKYDIDKEEKDIILNWGFFAKFYAHPLLPKRIAQKIRVFNITNWGSKPYKDVKNENCLILGARGFIHDDNTCYYYTTYPLNTVPNFKQAVIELRREVEIWLRSYGIKDLNITTSHWFDLTNRVSK